jgi:flagellar M-ring protein FliF
LDRFVSQFKIFYGALDPVRKKVLYGALAVSVIAIAIVGWATTRNSYDGVLKNDRPERVKIVAAELEERGISYRITDGGMSLEVPQDIWGVANKVARDAPTGPVGEDLPKIEGLMTPRDRREFYNHQRQESVARKLATLRNVRRAYVVIVPAERGTYIDDESLARASVLLVLDPGAKFSQESIRAMVNMVRNSVDGLDENHISITSDAGQVLWGGARQDGENFALVSRTRALEKDLERKVARHLLYRLGSTMHFSVTAIVELNTETATTETTVLDPDGLVQISSTITEETSSKGSVGGIAGVDANLPERKSAASNSGFVERISETINSEPSRKHQVTHQEPGSVKRWAIAVQIDERALSSLMGRAAAEAGEDVDPGQAADDAAWRKEQTLSFEGPIRAAMAFNEPRGDVLYVSVVPFAERPVLDPSGGVFDPSPYLPFVRYAVAILAVVLFFSMVLKPLVSRVTDVKTPDEVAREEEKAAAAEEAAQAEAEGDLGARLRELVENFEAVDAEDLNRLVESQDRAAAQVIRLWSRGD